MRVIDYTVDDGRDVDAGPYRLFTTMLDPDEVPAVDLAAAYAQRWEIESAFDELKTHQRGSEAGAAIEVPGARRTKRSGGTCAATTRSAP